MKDNQSTATLTRLKSKLIHTLVMSIFLTVCECWIPTAWIQRRFGAPKIRCYPKILNISCRDYITNEVAGKNICILWVTWQPSSEGKNDAAWTCEKIIRPSKCFRQNTILGGWWRGQLKIIIFSWPLHHPPWHPVRRSRQKNVGR